MIKLGSMNMNEQRKGVKNMAKANLSAVTSTPETPSTPETGNSAERFIRVWQGANSVDEVAKELGITKLTATRRAITMRGKKVPLKKMNRGKARLDYTKLAEVAASLAPQSK